MLNSRRLSSFSPVFALIAATALSGCLVDAGESLFILKNQAPDDQCNFGTAKDGAFISRGLLDVANRNRYTFTPLVESRAQAVENGDPLQRTILVEGAEITLELEDGISVDSQFTNFTQRFSGTIEPGDLALFVFDIVPPEVSDALASSLSAGDVSQLLATVQMFGELGNGDVESPEFTFPIQACNDCLRGINAPSCVDFDPSALDMSCLPGQDGFQIDCCVSGIDQSLVCPPVNEPSM